MSKLREPLHQELSDPASEQEIKSLWMGVQRRRARKQGRTQVRRGATMAFSVAFAVCALLLWFWRPARNPGPLTLGGSPIASLSAGSARRAQLSDGSTLELGQAAQLEVLDNSGQNFGTALRSGSVVFDVKPGGPRRWTIDAGLASVEVIGTKFTVSRSPHAVEVSVERGVVLVRGERVVDHVRRLTAGESVLVAESEPPSLAAPPMPEPPPPAAEKPRPAASATWVAPSFDQLIAAADVQRRQGDLHAAEGSLKSALASAPDSKRAALAAFTLGKLEMDNLGNTSQAAAAFGRAVSLGPPGAIAEDALGRLVEAEGQAGQLEKARADAGKYLTQFPGGRHEYAVRRWLEQP